MIPVIHRLTAAARSSGLISSCWSDATRYAADMPGDRPLSARCHFPRPGVEVRDVAIPHSRRMSLADGVVIHRSSRLAEAVHPTLLPPRTRVEETVLDLAEQAAGFDAAFGVVSATSQRRLTTCDRVGEAMSRRKKMRWRVELGEALGVIDTARFFHDLGNLTALFGGKLSQKGKVSQIISAEIPSIYFLSFMRQCAYEELRLGDALDAPHQDGANRGDDCRGRVQRPSACGMPTQPATVARWFTGTWSGTAALRLAYSPFWNALNSTQRIARCRLVLAGIMPPRMRIFNR